MGVTLAADGKELLCSTKNGKLWRLLSRDLTTTLHSASHTVSSYMSLGSCHRAASLDDHP